MSTTVLGWRANLLACTGAAAGAVGLTACAASAPTPPNGPPLQAVWQQHRATINYYGLTALYSCDGLESKVRTLLLYLGARPDLKVQMTGCDRAFDRPGHLTAVSADFYTLAPTSGGEGPDTVAAQWEHVTVRPMAPYWMGFGECELLQQIKPVVAGDFSPRGLDYHTACVPYDATISDYDLSGEFLKPQGSR